MTSAAAHGVRATDVDGNLADITALRASLRNITSAGLLPLPPDLDEIQAGGNLSEVEIETAPVDERTDPLSWADPGVRVLRPTVVTPRLPELERFVALESWEGVVEEVLADSFVARLQSTHGGSLEIAEIAIREVSRVDRELVVPGGYFYWSVGYRDSPSGQRTRASVIRFRRLPAWTGTDLESQAAWKRGVEVLFDDDADAVTSPLNDFL